MRPACCTFHGYLQLWIMNIDNSSGPKKDRPSNVNISATFRALATRAFFSLSLLLFISSRCSFLAAFPLLRVSTRSPSPDHSLTFAPDSTEPFLRESYRDCSSARGILLLGDRQTCFRYSLPRPKGYLHFRYGLAAGCFPAVTLRNFE